ncbi:hypothetical protein AMTRI_Chr01g132210 [Amborella trichopoda]
MYLYGFGGACLGGGLFSLSSYGQMNNMRSFIRFLLGFLGFRKIDPDQWEFGNEEFIRGQRHLLKNIHRRKPIHSHSQHHHQAQGNSSGAPSEPGKQELEDTIERLKREKTGILADLQRRMQQRHGMESQVQDLEDRLHRMENRQKQMIALLSQRVQKPGFSSYIGEQIESHKFISSANKKRRLPKPDSTYARVDIQDGRLIAFQSARDNSDGVSTQLINIEPFEKMESSLDSWESFFYDVGHACGEEMDIGSITNRPSTVILTELHATSEEQGVLPGPESPKQNASSLRLIDLHSSPELAESTNHVESPDPGPPRFEYQELANHAIRVGNSEAIPDSQTKGCGIDVNSEPASVEVHSSNQRVVGTVTSSAVQTGVNDVFWEQFLTETPGSTDTQEVQSAMRDGAYRKLESKQGEIGGFWWSKKNVDHLTEQMGQLTPAERT